MKPLRAVVCLLLSCYLFSSCAASYRPVMPNTLHYPESTTQGDNFWYKYDVLVLSHNRKLARKEFNSAVRVVAVKIYNNTGQTLKYGVNYKLYSGDQEAEVLAPAETAHYIRETVPLYLLYLLFTPMTLTTNNGTSSSTLPIGLIIGPALTGINVGVAATANSHFRNELEQYNLVNTEIKPGETVYGLIGIMARDYGTLSMKITGH